jgi:hypothetical protein
MILSTQQHTRGSWFLVYENWIFLNLRPGTVFHQPLHVSNEQNLHTSHVHSVTKLFSAAHSVSRASASSNVSWLTTAFKSNESETDSQAFEVLS